MSFRLDEATAVLERTPGALRQLLGGLPEPWLRATEGPGTWSPFVVLGHLVHGEEVDWVPRARIILEEGEARVFEPFDREAQLRLYADWTADALLDRFAELREQNLETLRAWDLGPDDLARRGRHPEIGTVTLGELLATWTAHDFAHLVQIGRVMAKRYTDDVGPWRRYHSLLTGERPRP